MEETATNGKCAGYRKISKLAEISDSKGRQIFEHLKQTGIIETTKQGTIIKKYIKRKVC